MAALRTPAFFEKNGFRNLLFFLLIYIFGSPFLSAYPQLAVLVHASLSIALLFSVYAVKKEQNYRTTAMALLLPVLILYWLGIYEILPFGRLFSYSLLCLYLGLLVITMAAQLRHYKKVTSNVLYGTLCLYLILGLFWGGLYALVQEMIPNAYGGTLLENSDGNNFHVFIYFSMVTLTTLGYGDIQPQTISASSLCQMEAIVGQFFTAVVIAWLVGNFVSERKVHS